jgi:hypothetical protein
VVKAPKRIVERYKAPRLKKKAPPSPVRVERGRIIIPKGRKGERVRVNEKTGRIEVKAPGRPKREFIAPATWHELEQWAAKNPGRSYTLVMPRQGGHERFVESSPQELFANLIAGSAGLLAAQNNLAKYVEIEEADEETEYGVEDE